MKFFWKFIYNEIFYNGHFQTWGSLAIIVSAGQLLETKITWDLFLITYAAFYLIYLNDRYLSLEVDSLTNIERSRHIKKIYKFIPFMLVLGIVLLFFLLYFFGSLYSFLFVSAMVVFGFLYPVFFKNLTKKIPCFKNFYVASVFSILILLPAVYYGQRLEAQGLAILSLMLVFTFLRGVMMQFFLDLKDIKGDKAQGLLTMGILIGEKKTYILLHIINLLTSLSFPALYFLAPNLALPPSILFLAALALWNSFFFEIARRGNFFGFVLGSGEFIYWPLFVYLGQRFLTF